MSLKRQPQCEAALFNYETTHKNDFRDFPAPPLYKTTYRAKPKKPQQEVKYKFIGTLVDWKERLPFDEMWQAKEIVRTNPADLQEPYGKIEDLGREKAQQTRPRLVLSPGVALDDVEPETREIIMNSVYISEANARAKEAVAPLFNIKSPLPDLPAKANPLKLPPLKQQYVAEEWRRTSATWDHQQVRCGIEPTKDFWLRRNQVAKRTK